MKYDSYNLVISTLCVGTADQIVLLCVTSWDEKQQISFLQSKIPYASLSRDSHFAII